MQHISSFSNNFLLLIMVVNGVYGCSPILKNGNVAVYFSAIGFKDVKVTGCISPKTINENEVVGGVLGIAFGNRPLPILYADSAGNFSRLEMLHISRVGVSTIEKGAFHNLPKLKTLGISRNKELQFMDYEIINNVPNLEQLYLYKNQLQYFDQRWFGKLDHLVVLLLSYNELQSVQRQAFVNFSKLSLLDLSYNRIQFIHNKAFEGLSYLGTLDLSSNLINSITSNHFSSVQILHTLNLFNNNITYFAENVFNSLTLLEELVISYNPITCVCYKKLLTGINNGVAVNKKNGLWCAPNQFEDFPACVISNDTTCDTHVEEDLYSVLHLQLDKEECYGAWAVHVPMFKSVGLW